MPSSSPGGLPLPALTDAPNVPSDFLTFAKALDPRTVPAFASATARDATYPASVAGFGARCRLNDTRQNYVVWYNSTSTALAWYQTTAAGTISVADLAARDALLVVEGLVVVVRATGTFYFYTGGAWTQPPAVTQGRVPFTVTSSVASGSALAPTITLPVLPYATTLNVQAVGRTGFAAAVRAAMWDWDSVPASMTGLTSDHIDQPGSVTAQAGLWVGLTAGLGFTCPAGVAPAFRPLLRADGNTYSRGAVIWTRTPA